MPVSAYFKGHGSEVMANMTKEYGAKKGKSVFYATANKKGMNPPVANPKPRLAIEGAYTPLKTTMSAHLNKMKSKGVLKSKKSKSY